VELRHLRPLCGVLTNEGQAHRREHRHRGRREGEGILSRHPRPRGPDGSGTPVPDLSIEVDDVDEALLRIKKAKIKIEYGPADEPWSVRRFYVRDPFGKLVNILMHV
jgi:catechol 2,3-dioxygenase-like lactoylglutathione lyase family enzyme